jgi:hypothetical protein
VLTLLRLPYFLGAVSRALDDADHPAARAADDHADRGADRTLVPTHRSFGSQGIHASAFCRLLHLEDDAVMRILAFVMAETSETHSGTVDALGALFGTDGYTRGFSVCDEPAPLSGN